MTEIILITGTNAIGKTQWMLQNIGCQPDLKFANRYDAKHTPIVGEMNEICLIADLVESRIQIFTRSLTKKERENLDETLVEIPSKIFFPFHFSNDHIVKIFHQLQQWNVEEIYIASITPITASKFMEYLTKPTDRLNKKKNILQKIQIQLPKSLQYLFIEKVNDDKFISIIDMNGNPTKFNPEVNTQKMIDAVEESFKPKIVKLQQDIKKGIKKNIEYDTIQKEIQVKKEGLHLIHNQFIQVQKETELLHNQLYAMKDQYTDIIEVKVFLEKIQENEQYCATRQQLAEILSILDTKQNQCKVLSDEIDEMESHLKRKKYYDIERMQNEVREYQEKIVYWRNLHE